MANIKKTDLHMEVIMKAIKNMAEKTEFPEVDQEVKSMLVVGIDIENMILTGSIIEIEINDPAVVQDGSANQKIESCTIEIGHTVTKIGTV